MSQFSSDSQTFGTCITSALVEETEEHHHETEIHHSFYIPFCHIHSRGFKKKVDWILLIKFELYTEPDLDLN